MSKPIICLDFDGVVHQYDDPWTKATEIANGPTEGFFDWLHQMLPKYKIVISSSRCNDPEAIPVIRHWLMHHFMIWEQDKNTRSLEPMDIEISATKPPAFITIDDRALTFKGDWTQFTREKIKDFKPWNKVPPPTDYTSLSEDAQSLLEDFWTDHLAGNLVNGNIDYAISMPIDVEGENYELDFRYHKALDELVVYRLATRQPSQDQGDEWKAFTLTNPGIILASKLAEDAGIEIELRDITEAMPLDWTK